MRVVKVRIRRAQTPCSSNTLYYFTQLKKAIQADDNEKQRGRKTERQRDDQGEGKGSGEGSGEGEGEGSGVGSGEGSGAGIESQAA